MLPLLVTASSWERTCLHRGLNTSPEGRAHTRMCECIQACSRGSPIFAAVSRQAGALTVLPLRGTETTPSCSRAHQRLGRNLVPCVYVRVSACICDCVCVCVCVYSNICICTCVSQNLCMLLSMYASMCVHACMHAYITAAVHLYLCACTCLRLRVRVRTNASGRASVHAHAYAMASASTCARAYYACMNGNMNGPQGRRNQG